MRGRKLRIVFALGLVWVIWYDILWVFTRLPHDQRDRPFSPVMDRLSISAAALAGLLLAGILARLWPTFYM
jgi:hypothetical protein